MNSMTLKTFFKKISDPVVFQLPFCAVSFCLLGFELLQDIHGRMLTYDPAITYNLLFCRVCNLLTLIYIQALLIQVICKKWFTVAVYGLVVILFSFKLFLTLTFGMKIRPTVLVLLAETNTEESAEFIQTFLFTPITLRICISIALIVLVIYLFEKMYKTYFLKRLMLKESVFLHVLIGTFLCFSMGCSYSFFSKLYECKNTDSLNQWELHYLPNEPLSQMAYSIYGLYLMAREETMFEKVMRNLDSNSATFYGDSVVNVIMVIGESYIKHHSALYGYKLPTTPLLSSEKANGRLFVYDNVVTPYGSTSLTIKNVLCTNSISDAELWNETSFFPSLFRQAGYDVYFWDNQKDFSPEATFSFALNSFLYNKSVYDMTYTQTNKRSFVYDEELVNSFDSLELSTPRNFIIFHLMGQHIGAKDRFPPKPEFLRFTVDSIDRNESWMTDEKRQYIADYDNATFYNDYVLYKIIGLFNETNTILFYFSDHGEEVYDYRDSQGRVSDNMSKNQVKYIFEIPFMIWCSDIYKQAHPEIIDKIAASLGRPFMIDNLCQPLFHVGGIQTKYYYEDRDLLSPNYKPRKRIISDTFDYDNVMLSK